jgi:hypothetical protein
LTPGLKQAELVERAVDEYVEHHRELFALRMERAHEALLGGKTSTLAYSLGVGEADVERVGGVSSDQIVVNVTGAPTAVSPASLRASRQNVQSALANSSVNSASTGSSK